MAEPRPLSGYSAADIEIAIHAALRARDFPAVATFMRVLAVKDPHRAEALLGLIQVASLLARQETTP